MPTAPTFDRRALLRFRFRRHQLDRPPGTARSRLPDIVDYGVQDTGPGGASWALEVRGAPPDRNGLVLAWTLRGAPHAYRQDDLDEVAVATAPYSEDDAAKRIFDASAPLRRAGIPVLDAMRTVAEHERKIVSRPLVKGEVSRRLTELVDEPFLRWCRPCGATHVYEQMFRLPALQGGLVLDWNTSPPVLRRVPRLKPRLFRTTADEAEPRFDVIRNHLRFYPGARVRDVAEFLDAPVKVVKEHWPDDAVEIKVKRDPAGSKAEPRFVLRKDLDQVDGDGASGTLRLLGPFDPYLQLRDRELLVQDAKRRKDVWRTLGRPGVIVVDGEVAGTWRPRTSGNKLTVQVEPWRALTKAEQAQLDEQGERMAEHRGLSLAAVTR